jgi:hypothetical protein
LIFFSIDRISLLMLDTSLDLVYPYLQLLQSEAPTSARAAVVLDSRALNNGSQTVDGAGSNASGFGDTGITTAVLAAGLLEVHLDPALPVLVEMPIGNDVVVFDRLWKMWLAFSLRD